MEEGGDGRQNILVRCKNMKTIETPSPAGESSEASREPRTVGTVEASSAASDGDGGLLAKLDVVNTVHTNFNVDACSRKGCVRQKYGDRACFFTDNAVRRGLVVLGSLDLGKLFSELTPDAVGEGIFELRVRVPFPTRLVTGMRMPDYTSLLPEVRDFLLANAPLEKVRVPSPAGHTVKPVRSKKVKGGSKKVKAKTSWNDVLVWQFRPSLLDSKRFHFGALLKCELGAGTGGKGKAIYQLEASAHYMATYTRDNRDANLRSSPQFHVLAKAPDTSVSPLGFLYGNEGSWGYAVNFVDACAAGIQKLLSIPNNGKGTAGTNQKKSSTCLPGAVLIKVAKKTIIKPQYAKRITDAITSLFHSLDKDIWSKLKVKNGGASFVEKLNNIATYRPLSSAMEKSLTSSKELKMAFPFSRDQTINAACVCLLKKACAMTTLEECRNSLAGYTAGLDGRNKNRKENGNRGSSTKYMEAKRQILQTPLNQSRARGQKRKSKESSPALASIKTNKSGARENKKRPPKRKRSLTVVPPWSKNHMDAFLGLPVVDDGEFVPTKKLIIEYLKLNAPKPWLKKRNFHWSLQHLCHRSTREQVAQLYTELLGHYEAKSGTDSGSTKKSSNAKKKLQRRAPVAVTPKREKVGWTSPRKRAGRLTPLLKASAEIRTPAKDERPGPARKRGRPKKKPNTLTGRAYCGRKKKKLAALEANAVAALVGM